MKKTLFALLLLLNTFTVFATPAFKCTIKGEVVNRTTKRLILFKSFTNVRVEANKTFIPIVNNHFELSFDVPEMQAYRLVFEDELENGTYDAIVFFPIAGEISFKLYPFGQSKKNQVKGGELNAGYARYYATLDRLFISRLKVIYQRKDSLFKIKKLFTPLHDSLTNITHKLSHGKVDPLVWKQLRDLRETGEEFTTDGKKLKKHEDQIFNEESVWKYKYIAANQNIFSYYLLADDVRYINDHKNELPRIQKLYPTYQQLFPDHSYTTLIATTLDGLTGIKPGNTIIAFSAPDLDKQVHHSTDLIKNKVTLIDLWGSWCGPCIGKTRTILPLYKQYHAKGFDVVGIAREYKTDKELRIALKREKYPWLNLLELDDQNKIWSSYGISNGTGMMVLVDNKGTILAVDPTAKEVEDILVKRL